MASRMMIDRLDRNENSLCLMCLEAPVVGNIGTCPHLYCKTCLLKHIEDQLKSSCEGETFPCPACRMAPSRVKEYVSEELRKIDDALHVSVFWPETGLGFELHGECGTSVAKMDSGVEIDVDNCAVCEYRDKQVKANKVCTECSFLKLCDECASAHAANKFTTNHFVASLKMQKNVLCGPHQKLLKSFCSHCDKPVCHICVMLDHKEHKIMSLAEVYRRAVVDVKAALDEEESRLQNFLADEKELRLSKATALLMEDTLIMGIEDHVEECIQMILKRKDELKKQVGIDFEVVRVLSDHLDDMPELIKKSKEAVAKAQQVLEEAELHPKCVMELMDINEALDDLENPDYITNRYAWKKKYEQLCQKSPTFYPKHQKLDIGSFKKPDSRKPAEICESQGFCTCSTCERSLKKPSPANEMLCIAKGICSCGTCGRGLCRPDPKKAWLCCKNGCSCITCGLIYQRSDPARIRICRERGTCTCGTCERIYDRKKLPGGSCNKCGTKVTVVKK